MTEKLKPCPFCGGQPEVTTKYEPSDDGDDWRWTFIECPMHRVITSADTWNTRPIEDAQAAEIERLRAVLEQIASAGLRENVRWMARKALGGGERWLSQR